MDDAAMIVLADAQISGGLLFGAAAGIGTVREGTGTMRVRP